MIEPINDYILIENIEEKKNGLIVPSNNIKKAKIINTSKKSKLNKNNIILYNEEDTEKYSTNKTYYLIKEDKIMAIIKGGENE